MVRDYKEIIKNHISTFSKMSAQDRDAVTTLDYFLKSDGRINTKFSSNDKWPNHDDYFEFVPNPDISRIPEQKFLVQIKGTNNYTESDGVVSYCLDSLAFPAYIHCEVTSDPGILFLVLNPDKRGRERVFWKYVSSAFINNIDFSKDSKIIKFTKDDEIPNNEDGINQFCERLVDITDKHRFSAKLKDKIATEENAKKIILYWDKEIFDFIEIISEDNCRRDEISRKIVKGLEDLCYATLILNAIKLGYNNVNEKLACEIAQLNRNTYYLYKFLKGLKYIDNRIPEDGQSERLMLKYYNYLWEIRAFLSEKYNIKILENLEKFPLDLDKQDLEYYSVVAEKIEKMNIHSVNSLRPLRYYIQKKTPFYINGKRYFEITLQLAGLYATKYNRLTVYSTKDIITDYSISINYIEEKIDLWGIENRIKILTYWAVSIMPSCLNKIGKIVGNSTSVKGTHGEYNNLMTFLTTSGINLFDFINFDDARFEDIFDKIYSKSKTKEFGNTLLILKNKYSIGKNYPGKLTIRYALYNMREEIFNSIIPEKSYYKKLIGNNNLSSKCYPFEKNPFVSNEVGSKSSIHDYKVICNIIDDHKDYNVVLPYLKLIALINKSGELYFTLESFSNNQEIEKYNNSLDYWEICNGYSIIEENGYFSIESYVKSTIAILNKLIYLSTIENVEQIKKNNKYLKESANIFDDPDKKSAILNCFTKSKLMLVYGAAGTGKTTLLNHISNLEKDYSQIFLSKTHTSLNNLKRRIENKDAKFASVDKLVKNKCVIDYDVIFIDECSTIDNRTMLELISLIPLDKKIVLAGDIYQIESIEFGNWFYYAKDIIKTKGANIELSHNWRTNEENLKNLWQEVREKKSNITEMLSMDGPYSDQIGENIFKEEDNDEVILCLNYDGKFGLNNMNQYFQNANNKSIPIYWHEWVFKVGDKILFIDVNRFSVLYNNLKGDIVEILKDDEKIKFTIDVYSKISKEDCEKEDITFIQYSGNLTRISFEVLEMDDDMSDDDKKKTVIPFQLAYAVSIHKAQGLEYKSVKVIIPSSNAEKITHSIFYTAITRAKEKLKIYWSPETMKSVIEEFDKNDTDNITLPIIKNKLGLI